MDWFWTAFVILNVTHGDSAEREYVPLHSFTTRMECEFFVGEHIQNSIESYGENSHAACIKTDEKIVNATKILEKN